MITYIVIVIALILWLVAPPLIDGHIKNKSDRKALRMLCRIISILFVTIAITRML